MKKLKKHKLFMFLLVLALLASVLPVPLTNPSVSYAAESKPTSGSCGKNIRWVLTPDTETTVDGLDTCYKLILSGSGEMPDYFSAYSQIPWAASRDYITSIEIMKGITSIGNYAFSGCKNLQSVTLPEGLLSIGEWSFVFDNSLTSLTLPDSLTTLKNRALDGVEITNLLIPENVTAIGSEFMGSGNKLKDIQVAEGNECFRVIDHVLYEQKNGSPYRAIVFAMESGGTSINIAQGTEIIDSCFCYTTDYYSTKSVSSITFPDTLKTIKEWALVYSRITELNFPDSVETIEPWAFDGSYYLKKVTIGNGLQDFEHGILSNCANIESIVISEQNPYLDAIDNVVYNEEHTQLCYYATGKKDTVYHLLSTTETIKTGAITYASKLKELYLTARITAIPESGICSNNNLIAIYIPGNAPALVTRSIADNHSELIIWRTAESTGWDDSKWNSFSFQEWDPGSDVVEKGAFGDVSWQYQGDIGRITFTGSGDVPDFNEDTQAPWSSYQDSIRTVQAEGITGIGANAFTGAPSLIRMDASESLQSIGESAFSDCEKLLYIRINSVETIGRDAFANDVSLKNPLTLGKVSFIGTGAFAGCRALPSATLGARLQSLEENMFSGCSSLTNVIVPESVTSIKRRAFMGCSALRTINIPSAVDAIETEAFSETTGLERVYFYGAAPQNWESDSFNSSGSTLKLYYRGGKDGWDQFSGSWNNIPLEKQERFYTEKYDQYSFANSPFSFGYSSDYRIPRERYVDVMGSFVAGSFFYSVDPKWEGSCYGMAGTALEFYENPEFDVRNYQADASNLYEISTPRRKDADITKLIEAYQISQYRVQDSGRSLANLEENCRNIVQRVEEFERSGGLRVDEKAEPIVLLLYSLYSGHAVVPVSVDQAENGDFLLKVYDPNYPTALQTLKINKDFSGISYQSYIRISYLDYSEVTNAMSNAGKLRTEQESEQIHISIDKEAGTVINEEGKGMEEIEGAYEQIPLNDGEDEFCGIRNFVLPKGEYQVAVTESEEGVENAVSTGDAANNADSVTFYLMDRANFVKVTSSDEKAVLHVSEPDGKEGMKIRLQTEPSMGRTASVSLMSQDGMERTIEIENSDAVVDLVGNNAFTVKLEGKGTISIDGTKVEGGEAEGFFAVSEEQSSLKLKDFQTDAACNASNKLSGTLAATLISDATSEKEVTIKAEYLDSEGNTAAVYSENKQLKPGMNFINLSFEELDTSFSQKEGEIDVSCHLTVEDASGKKAGAQIEGIKMTLTKQDDPEGPDEPDDPKDPEEPDEPDDPKDPEEPDEPDDPKVSLIIEDLATDIVCDSLNRLAGTVEAKVILEGAAGKKVVIKTEYFDTKGKAVAAYTEERQINAGENRVRLSFQEVETAFDEKEGEVKLSCRLTAEDESGEKASAQIEGIKVTLTKQAVTTDPDKTIDQGGKKDPQPPKESQDTEKPGNNNIEDVKVTKVKTSVKKLVLGKGETVQLDVSVEPKNAANKKLTYTSSNKKVKVSNKGKITANKVGTAKITITSANGKKAGVNVIVKKAPKKVTLNKKSKTLTVGKTFKIKAKVPKNTASWKITYSSNKKKVASVSSSGKVKAKKKGKATITVRTFNGKTAKLKVTVK